VNRGRVTVNMEIPKHYLELAELTDIKY
jgi:hypothetical protein